MSYPRPCERVYLFTKHTYITFHMCRTLYKSSHQLCEVKLFINHVFQMVKLRHRKVKQFADLNSGSLAPESATLWKVDGGSLLRSIQVDYLRSVGYKTWNIGMSLKLKIFISHVSCNWQPFVTFLLCFTPNDLRIMFLSQHPQSVLSLQINFCMCFSTWL